MTNIQKILEIGLEEYLEKNKTVVYKQYEQKYAATVICNGQTKKAIGNAEFFITTNGEYQISATGANGMAENVTAKITQCKEEKYSTIYTENTELTIDNYKVTVPAGFAIGTSENVSHVTTGLVITDNIDSEGNSIGNEFVWIPVKEDLTVGNTGKEMAKLQDESTIDYRGVLYDWESDQTGNTTFPWSSTSKENREPDVLADEQWGQNDSRWGITKVDLQNEYNTMIDSVKKYGGFYIARYEMAIENESAISKIGVSPVECWEYSDNWNGLYTRAKTYNNSYNKIQSSMIWGSQYDAMLNFALASGNDSNKVHSNEYGNYSASSLPTGATKTLDVINNIYDLAGNKSECTLEANFDGCRVMRGMNRWGDIFSPASRDDNNYADNQRRFNTFYDLYKVELNL